MPKSRKSPTRKRVRQEQGTTTPETSTSDTHLGTGGGKRPFSALEQDTETPPGQPGTGTAESEPGPAAKQPRLTEPETDQEPAQFEAMTRNNTAALTTIYKEFYANGTRKDKKTGTLSGEQLNRIYRIMTDATTTEYASTPVSDQEFQDFLDSAKSMPVRIAGQRESQERYKKWKADDERWKDAGRKGPRPQPPSQEQSVLQLKEQLAKGDYFYGSNNSDKLRSEVKNNPERRLIVNVRSQQAALKVARNLNPLFADTAVSPFLKDYKVYLTQKPGDTNVKHDKLAVYYSTDPDAPGDDDTVGETIVAAIEEVLTDADASVERAPFYAPVSRAVAWAEEPKHFLKGMENVSFSQSRQRLIASVIEDPNLREISDAQMFSDLVAEAFFKNGVNPVTPHRHLDQS
jgi:hypothetical protein